MAMHLIDRPHFDHGRLDHSRLSAAASVALHAAVILTIVAALRNSPDKQTTTAAPLLMPGLVWIPSLDMGGGRDNGGAHAIEPPRRVRAIGSNEISVPASPQRPSADSVIEPQENIPALPAQPMGNANQILAGAVHSEGVSTGPGDTGSGTAPGPDKPGLGNGRGPSFGDGALPGGPGVTMPTLIERVPPKYTVEAMQARIQGSVWIECVVQADGTVGDARVTRSLDRRFGLDEEAIAAAKRWRFRPGLLNGKPVPVIVSIELMFSVR
jgi:protein TonB